MKIFFTRRTLRGSFHLDILTTTFFRLGGPTRWYVSMSEVPVLTLNFLKMFSAASSSELPVTDSLDIHIWSIAHYTLRFLFNLDHLVDLLGDSKFGLKSREVFFQFIEILFNTFQVLIKIIL